MDDFNEYLKKSKESSENSQGENTNNPQNNIFNLVNSLAGKYDGKNQNELLTAIYYEAKKGKKAGTLTNAQIDNFAQMISPFLDAKQKSMLIKLVNELKKI